MTDRNIEIAVRPARAADAAARVRRPLRFLAAGGIATAVHWGVMWLLIPAGHAPLHATAVGGLAGAAANYGLQRRLTFGHGGAHAGAVPRYLVSCAAAWLVNLLAFQSFHALAGLPVVPSQLAATAAAALMSYLVYERWVFHD